MEKYLLDHHATIIETQHRRWSVQGKPDMVEIDHYKLPTKQRKPQEMVCSRRKLR